jgi:hypothetical protein
MRQVPDIEVAMSAYQQNLQQHLAFLQAVISGYSIARAVETDGQIIATLTKQETRDQCDRELASQLNGEDAGFNLALAAPEDMAQDIA